MGVSWEAPSSTVVDSQLTVAEYSAGSAYDAPSLSVFRFGVGGNQWLPYMQYCMTSRPTVKGEWPVRLTSVERVKKAGLSLSNVAAQRSHCPLTRYLLDLIAPDALFYSFLAILPPHFPKIISRFIICSPSSHQSIIFIYRCFHVQALPYPFHPVQLPTPRATHFLLLKIAFLMELR